MREKNVYELAYADDVVLMATEEGEIRRMVRTLGKYI